MNYQFVVFIHAGRQSALPAWISDCLGPIIPPPQGVRGIQIVLSLRAS